MEVKRKVSVQSVFWRFLLWFCAVTGGLLLLAVLLFLIASGAGMLLPANYGETVLEENRTVIQEAGKVTEDMIPDTCRFGVYSEDGTFLYGNLAEKARTGVWQRYEQGGSSYGSEYFKVFPRENEICIAVYYIKAEFTDPVLRKYLPGAPESLLLLFLSAFLIECVILVRRFGRIFREELESVKQVTEKVQLKDLDFRKPDTRIREIDEVMDSLIQMKDALEISLKQQWKLEENRRQQVRALVHDIKTPLTVIRGSTQLLDEAESREESREYQTYILQETDRIEQYVLTLQEMLKSEGDFQPKEEKIEIRNMAESFRESAKMLTDAKKQSLEVVISLQSDYIISDRQFLGRAWENLLNNAVEYTPEGGMIWIRIKEEGDWLCLRIEDSGPGFTEEDLRHAAEQFYQGDKSRNSEYHYGIGLFTVQSFAKQQGGSLVLSNSDEDRGACVCLYIPVKTGK
ncbi:sensor histidine kinase [Faecalicatena orotica]|uniref:sensor histidine kinase n=1 Tax=Faecalicatena orotica TaxID=1544 RepID=UPI003216F1BA